MNDNHKLAKECLHCGHEPNENIEEYIFCTKCGHSLRNECTGTSSFKDEYDNNTIYHNFENEDIYVLNVNDAYCPKCGSISSFAKDGLIDIEYN